MTTIEQIKELLDSLMSQSAEAKLQEANHRLQAAETVIAKQVLELARRDADALRRRSVKPKSFMEWLDGPHHPDPRMRLKQRSGGTRLEAAGT